jgi:hypothetical protein
MTDARREYEQLSGAEVPGFHARTVIDDTIGKLYALRLHLSTEAPTEEVQGLLDDLEAAAEKLIDAAYDEDAKAIYGNDPQHPTPRHLRRWGGPCLGASGSDALYWCSCGAPTISEPTS